MFSHSLKVIIRPFTHCPIVVWLCYEGTVNNHSQSHLCFHANRTVTPPVSRPVGIYDRWAAACWRAPAWAARSTLRSAPMAANQTRRWARCAAAARRGAPAWARGWSPLSATAAAAALPRSAALVRHLRRRSRVIQAAHLLEGAKGGRGAS